MAEQRNWADLSTDLLHLIYTKLPSDLHHFVRFRSVCKDWRSSVLLSNLPPQLPWLLEYDNPCLSGISLQQNLHFYSFATGETATIRVPEPYRGMRCHGPGHGYLLVSSLDQQVLYLLNPLTGVEISLPKLGYTFRTLSPACSGLDPINNWHIVARFIKNSDERRWNSVIYHPNTNNWTYVDDNLHNTCRWGGRLFVTKVGHCTRVFNAVSGEKLDEVPPPEDQDEDIQVMSICLVESCGEILRVSWYIDFDGTEEVDHSTFSIYKLSSDGGEQGSHRWVKLSDIGDQIVFLDEMNGFSMGAPAGFNGNCIYFLSYYGGRPCSHNRAQFKHEGRSSEGGERGPHHWVKVSNIGDQIVFSDLINGFSMRAPAGFKGNCMYFLSYFGGRPCRYDIGTGTVERVPCPFNYCTWFIPNLL